MKLERNTKKDNNKIVQLKAAAEEHLLPPSDVDTKLKDIASDLNLSSLGVKIDIRDVEHQWGTCEGPVILTTLINKPNNVRISLYTDDSTKLTDMYIQTAMHQLSDAFMAVWASDYRNEHGGLNLKAGGISDVFPNSVSQMARQQFHPTLTIAWIDLDRFKKINDSCSHEEGDKALRAVYAQLHQLARNLSGLAFFDGGDEFILILPTTQKMKLISEIWKIRNEIRNLRYPVKTGGDDLTLDMTVGVVERTVAEIIENLGAVKTACEDLTKNDDSEREKRRGTINFEIESHVDSVPAVTVNPLSFFQLGLSLSHCHQFRHHAFPDERLNLIVEKVSSVSLFDATAIEVIKEAVNDVLKWFGVETNRDFDEADLLNSPLNSRRLSMGAIAVAILHGLAVAVRKHNLEHVASELVVRWSGEDRKVAIQYGEVTIWGDSDLGGTPLELNYGKSWTLTGEVNKVEGAVVGVQVGFSNKPLTPGGNNLPLAFFVDHILVDDRPRSGGGLPDFWQIAIAQIITALGKAPECNILIWGKNAESVKETDTYQRLMGEKEWEADDVAQLTGLTAMQVDQIKTSIPARIKIVSDSKELLGEIITPYQVFVGRQNADVSESKKQSPVPRPMINTEKLGPSEGVSCLTADMAYPLVIDTLRKSEDVRLPKDDSNQEHRELLAFKIKLKTPLKDPIPSYLRGQQEEFEKYADDVLLRKEGLIRRELENPDQVEVFITHLSSYFGKNNSNLRSTRRACLVVPHTPEKNEPKPLGLISVWATPRFSNGGRFLDFIFVWRTVEAFIGLPYSLYGSIRLAQQLVESIATKLSNNEESAQVQLGELTYLALSLHLGSDEFNKRVAKQIVDSASD